MVPGYPCLLHYLELAELGQKCRSCPICFDTIYGRELKSVKWFDPVSAASESEALLSPKTVSEQEVSDVPTESLHTGDYITMRLIYRTTISTLALPKSATWPSELIPPHSAPWHFAPDILSFSRFMLATPDYMGQELRNDLQQLDREIITLQQLGTPADDLGLVFVESAKRKVLEQVEKVAILRTDSVQKFSESVFMELEALGEKAGAFAKQQQRAQEQVTISSTTAEDTDDYVPPDVLLNTDRSAYALPAKSKKVTSPPPSNVHTNKQPTHTSRNNRTRRNVNPPAPDATYLFYQASSGQHIYLHPLDIKILKSYFETYSAFPLAIRFRVEGTDEGSMNDDLRKRCRYLSHLPEACDLTFVEADLASVIPQHALAPYAQALRKRQAKRKERVRKDDRARLRSEQAAIDRERESVTGRRSYSRTTNDDDIFPVLQEMSIEEHPESADLPPALSISAAAQAGASSDASNSEKTTTTVWGTRVPASLPAVQRRQQEEDDSVDSAMQSAWNDFDAMDMRGGRRQSRKKKVVINLSGGAVSIRR